MKTLVNSERDAGFYQVNWEGLDTKGMSVPNGIYFYRLEAASMQGDVYAETRKLIILKK